MFTTIILRGNPKITLGNGTVDLKGEFETYHAVLVESLSVIPMSLIVARAMFDQHPVGDKPENMHSEAWVGIGPSGEDNPLASSISKVRAWLDWRGLPTVIEAKSVALVANPTLFFGVEIGVDDQWAIASLPSQIRDIATEVTPPIAPPSGGMPLTGKLILTINGAEVVYPYRIEAA